jgi:hypothetical protein
MKRIIISALTALLLGGLLISSAAASTTITPNGTWEAYPGQSASFGAAVQQPINADNSSNFKANGKTVIPVKFALSQGTGAFVFESIGSDASPDNDYSFVSFTPNATVTFNDITELSSMYAFTLGDCHGGSLRWQVRTSSTQAVYIYYGNPPQFGNGGTGGCTATSPGGVDQSGDNLIGLLDLRYDTSQYAGGTFYDTYAHAQTLIGTTPILRASLVLDGGWGGDQVVDLTSATVAVGGTNPYTETFTPEPASAVSPVCPTEAATITITKADNTPTGAVNEPISIQPQDNDGIFRIVDCKYMYNLATSSLTGVGTYTVFATIDGTTFRVGSFDLK